MPLLDPTDNSNPALRLGFLLAALVMAMAAASSALAAEGRWALAIGTATAAPQTAVEIPVVLSTNGARVSAIAFSVDFDASKLVLDADPTLGSKVEIPAPTKFTSSSWVGSEAGEIGVAVYDRTRPIGALGDGTIARIRFRVLPGASGFAPVRVSVAKPYSAAGPSAEPLDGEIVPGGGVTIAAATGSNRVQPREDRGRTVSRPLDSAKQLQIVVPLVSGAPGSLILHNGSEALATARLTFLRAGFDPAGPTEVHVPPGATRSWADPAPELFGLPGAGAILVESSNEALLGATAFAPDSPHVAAAVVGDRDLRAIALSVCGVGAACGRPESDPGQPRMALTIANVQAHQSSFLVEIRDAEGALLDSRRIDANALSTTTEILLANATARAVVIRAASDDARFAAWVTTRIEREPPAIQTAR